jgi:hypothetical protein
VEDVKQTPPGALLRLDQPGPGIAAVFTMDLGETVMAVFSFYLYGDQAAANVAASAAVAGVGSGTLPDADGISQERVRTLKIIEQRACASSSRGIRIRRRRSP